MRNDDDVNPSDDQPGLASPAPPTPLAPVPPPSNTPQSPGVGRACLVALTVVFFLVMGLVVVSWQLWVNVRPMLDNLAAQAEVPEVESTPPPASAPATLEENDGLDMLAAPRIDVRRYVAGENPRIDLLRRFASERPMDVPPEHLSELQTLIRGAMDVDASTSPNEAQSLFDYPRMMHEIRTAGIKHGRQEPLDQNFLYNERVSPTSFERIEVVSVARQTRPPGSYVVLTVVSDEDRLPQEMAFWVRYEDQRWRLYDWMIVLDGESKSEKLADINFRLSPNQYLAYVNFMTEIGKIDTCLADSDYEAADSILDNLLQHRLNAGPADNPCRIRLCYALYNVGRYEQTIAAARQFRSPSQVPAKMMFLALAHAALGQHESAIAAADSYLDIVGYSPAILETKHVQLWSLARYDEAFQARREIVEGLPHNIDAMRDLLAVTPTTQMRELEPKLQSLLTAHQYDDAVLAALAEAPFETNRVAGLDMLMRLSEGQASERALLPIRATIARTLNDVESALEIGQRQIELASDEESRLALQDSLVRLLLFRNEVRRAYDVAPDKPAALLLIRTYYVYDYLSTSIPELLSLCESHLESFPEDADARYFAAILTGDDFRRDDAIAQLKQLGTEAVDAELKSRIQRSLSAFLLAEDDFRAALEAAESADEFFADAWLVLQRKASSDRLEKLIFVAQELGVADDVIRPAQIALFEMRDDHAAHYALLKKSEPIGNMKLPPMSSERLRFLLNHPEVDPQALESAPDASWQSEVPLYVDADNLEYVQRFLTECPENLHEDPRFQHLAILAAREQGDWEHVEKLIGISGWYLQNRVLDPYEKQELAYVDIQRRLKSGLFDEAMSLLGLISNQPDWVTEPGAIARLTAVVKNTNQTSLESDPVHANAIRCLILLLQGDRERFRQVLIESPNCLTLHRYTLNTWCDYLNPDSDVVDAIDSNVFPDASGFPNIGTFVLLFDKELSQDWLSDFQFEFDAIPISAVTDTRAPLPESVWQLSADTFRGFLVADDRPLTSWDLYSDDWIIDIRNRTRSRVMIAIREPQQKQKRTLDEIPGLVDWLVRQIEKSKPIGVYFVNESMVFRPEEAVVALKAWKEEIEQQPDFYRWNADLGNVFPTVPSEHAAALRREALYEVLPEIDLTESRQLSVCFEQSLEFLPQNEWFRVVRIRQSGDAAFELICEVTEDSPVGGGSQAGDLVTIDSSEVRDWRLE